LDVFDYPTVNWFLVLETHLARVDARPWDLLRAANVPESAQVLLVEIVLTMFDVDLPLLQVGALGPEDVPEAF
jgi:hypothetical protein